jgi:UDP-N-acetylglucosamine--N-acetylmuramyl-(pentapeptide) pyrophosphoryl-undecaprenol N-acetylglucosamine transferase
VVVGGSLGAKVINDTMITIGPELVKHFSIVHIAGIKQYEELKQKVPQTDSYKLIAFLNDHLGRLLGATDIVVTRAGASSMAELAATGPNVIMVPGSQLADQQKNAKVFLDANAAILFDEKRLKDNPKTLLEEIMRLWDDKPRRQSLSRALALFARPEAAKKMADLIEKAGRWQ